MVKNDILENEVIELGAASVETKGFDPMGIVDTENSGVHLIAGGIQNHD